MKKQTGYLALTLVSAGLALFTLESFTALIADAQTSNSFIPNQQIGVSLSHKSVFEQSANLSNLASGDSGSGTLEVTNTGLNRESLTIKNTLSGDIFRDNGKTGTSFGEARGPGDTEQGISVDYAAHGDQSRWEFDNHPLQIS